MATNLGLHCQFWCESLHDNLVPGCRIRFRTDRRTNDAFWIRKQLQSTVGCNSDVRRSELAPPVASWIATLPFDILVAAKISCWAIVLQYFANSHLYDQDMLTVKLPRKGRPVSVYCVVVVPKISPDEPPTNRVEQRVVVDQHVLLSTYRKHYSSM